MNATLAEFRDGKVPWPTLRQEGQTVFRWAVWDMAKVAAKTLEVAGITAADLAAFIPHQANIRIIDEFARQLRLPKQSKLPATFRRPETPRRRRSPWQPTGCSPTIPN